MVCETFIPLVGLAGTNGPFQPEFAGFEPVSTTDMVNPLTGQFTYNIPLVDVPGPSGSSYAMSLAYHSGLKPEDQASWVGWGWTLNPGAVIRQKRNMPDDLDNIEVEKFSKAMPNVSWGTMNKVTVKEKFDIEKSNKNDENNDDPDVYKVSWKSIQGHLAVNLWQRYNSLRGWSLAVEPMFSVSGVKDSYECDNGLEKSGQTSLYQANVSMTISDEPISFSGSISPLNTFLQLYPNDYKQSYGFNIFGDSYLNLDNVNPSNSYHLNTKPRDFSFSDVHYSGYSVQGQLGYHETENANEGKSKQKNAFLSVTNYEDKRTLRGSGYMRPFDVGTGNDAVFDYLVEKEHEFSMHQDTKRFLPIPLSGADYFVTTGMGVQGQFKFYHNKMMSVRPPTSSGDIEIWTCKPELMLPKNSSNPNAATGGGVNFGLSTKFYGVLAKIGDSEYRTEANSDLGFKSTQVCTRGFDNPPQSGFRFLNDMGGKNVGMSGGYIMSPSNYGRKLTTKNYIGYRTVDEVDAEKKNASASYIERVGVTTYGKNNAPKSSYSGIGSSIGELAVFDDNGGKYVYGLPVYAMNEQTWQYCLFSPTENLSTSVPNNYRIYSSHLSPGTDPGEGLKKLSAYHGQRTKQAYASEFLLTEVTTPDYVDVTRDGLTDDDLGGYTKFDYRRPTANQNSLFKWRAPSKGFSLQKNKISVSKDDYACVSFGEKEIYYLHTIETKTHIAYFVTNKTPAYTPRSGVTIAPKHTDERMDAYPAPTDENNAGNTTSNVSGINQSEYLDNIQVFTKDINGLPNKLIKTVRFEYDYSLMKNDPSSVSGNGKLTLRKLWIEGDGVANAMISPYTFIYQYPTCPSGLPANYSSKYNEYASLSQSSQNPDYDPDNIDRWGYYCENGMTRKGDNILWNSQFTSASFDPSAWHLKVVKLPSGGEIHVQYEQNDYGYVQDRKAMIMAQLDPASSDDSFSKYALSSFGGTSGNNYYLDFSSSISDSEINRLADSISDQFVRKGEKMYFKFLYNLKGQGFSGSSNSEYICGYAKVNKCEIAVVNSKKMIRIQLGKYTDYSSIPGISTAQKMQDYATRPLSAAYDFKKANNLEDGDDGTSALSQATVGLEQLGSTVASFLNAEDISTAFDYANAATTGPAIYRSLFLVPDLQPTRSFLRIPWNKAKLGGGIRVKRLLMYNPSGSLEKTSGGDQMVYGTEYIYKEYNQSTQSLNTSGVALNEPTQAREENSLVRLIGDGADQYVDQLVAGDQIINYEGPIGEELLPSATVNYSQVIAVNINNGPSVGGFTVSRYNTCKEQAYKSVAVTYAPMSMKEEITPAFADYDFLFPAKATTCQANSQYDFTLNNMHGTVKSVLKYAGDYNDQALSQRQPVSSQEYTYYENGSPVPTMSDLNRPFKYEDVGKEVEVLEETRRSNTNSETFQMQFSLGYMKNPVPPATLIFGLAPYISFDNEQLTTRTVSNVTSYPIFLQSITSSQDGIVHRTKNVAFDPSSGEPVVTQTSDGYDALVLGSNTQPHKGSYYSYTIPMHSQYAGAGKVSVGSDFEIYDYANSSTSTRKYNEPLFGDISISVNTTNSTLSFSYPSHPASEILKDPNSKLLQIDQSIENGDLIELRTKTQPISGRQVYFLEKTASSVVPTANCSCALTYSLRSISNVSSSLPSNNSDIVSIKVLKSNRSNQLAASAGKIVVYGGDEYVNKALSYAGILYERQKYVDALNTKLMYSGLYTGSLIFDQTLTFFLPNASYCSRAYDAISAFNIFLNGGLSGTDPGYIFEYRVDCENHQIVTSILDNQRNVVSLTYPHPVDPCIVSLTENLPYSGSELFGVNDDGELTYYTFINGITHEANTNWRFRGGSRVQVRNPDQSISIIDPLSLSNPGHVDRTNAFAPELDQFVISAEASEFSRYFPHDLTLEGLVDAPSSYNLVAPFESNTTILKPVNSYAYNVQRKKGSDEPVTGDRVYTNAGTYLTTFAPFDWHSSTHPDAWVLSNHVSEYSPQGVALQDNNAIGISSATLNGYHGRLPACTAVNAKRTDIYYQSFEDTGMPRYTNSNFTSGTFAHTGRKSMAVKENQCRMLQTSIQPQSQKTYMIRLWMNRFIKVDNVSDYLKYSQNIGSNSAGTAFNPSDCKRIARVGEWTLYEYNLSLSPSSNQEPLTLIFCPGDASTTDNSSVMNKKKGGNKLLDIDRSNEYLFVDDIKIQPVDASMTCYVYDDASLRLTASLNDDHFSSQYQYNAEGKYLRNISETSRGMFTLSEKETNLKKEYRPGVAASLPAVPKTNEFKKVFDNSMIKYPSYPRNMRPSRPNGSQINSKQDLFDLDVSPDKYKVKAFGTDIDSLKIPTFNSDSLNIKAKSVLRQVADSTNNSIKHDKIQEFDTSKERIEKDANALRKEMQTNRNAIQVHVDTLKSKLHLIKDSIEMQKVKRGTIK